MHIVLRSKGAEINSSTALDWVVACPKHSRFAHGPSARAQAVSLTQGPRPLASLSGSGSPSTAVAAAREKVV